MESLKNSRVVKCGCLSVLNVSRVVTIHTQKTFLNITKFVFSLLKKRKKSEGIWRRHTHKDVVPLFQWITFSRAASYSLMNVFCLYFHNFLIFSLLLLSKTYTCVCVHVGGDDMHDYGLFRTHKTKEQEAKGKCVKSM